MELAGIWRHLTTRPRSPFLTGAILVLALWALSTIFLSRGTENVNAAAASLKDEVWDNIKVQHLLPPIALSSTAIVSGQSVSDLDRVLTNKFHYVNKRALHHLEMTMLLAKYEYAQCIMVIITTCATGVLLFFVGRKGFNNVDPNILVGVRY